LGPRGPPAPLKTARGQSSGNAVAGETIALRADFRRTPRRNRGKTNLAAHFQLFTAHNEPWLRCGKACKLAVRVAALTAQTKQQAEGKMIKKIAGIARILAELLAIVAAFVAIPNIDVALILVVLGLIAGLEYDEQDSVVRLFLVVLVLGPVSGALGTIPEIGDELGTVAFNIALAAAGASATVIAVRLFKNAKDDLSRLTAK
jgi:hypothetical protein